MHGCIMHPCKRTNKGRNMETTEWRVWICRGNFWVKPSRCPRGARGEGIMFRLNQGRWGGSSYPDVVSMEMLEGLRPEFREVTCPFAMELVLRTVPADLLV